MVDRVTAGQHLAWEFSLHCLVSVFGYHRPRLDKSTVYWQTQENGQLFPYRGACFSSFSGMVPDHTVSLVSLLASLDDA